MARPACRLHPGSKIQRRGHYGKHNEFIRWVYVPADGDKPHYLGRAYKADLRVKLVGGLGHGSCDECERLWLSTDGLTNTDYDKFVLREKARALVRIAEGMSYKTAAYRVRQRAARRLHRPAPRASSKDGRMARDWIGQHAPVIAERYLPAEWPEAIAVDSFDVRITVFDDHGQPLKKGIPLYYVHGAAGYGPDFGRSGRLWHLAVTAKNNEAAYRDFFCQLGGRRNVRIVVCDGAVEIANAARWAFPNAEVYPCIWHLFHGLEVHLRRARLWNNRRAIFKAFCHRGPWDLNSWDDLREILLRYLAADLSRLDERQQQAIAGVGRRRAPAIIEQALSQRHWPRDLALLGAPGRGP